MFTLHRERNVFNGTEFQCDLCKVTGEGLRLEISDLEFVKIARITERTPSFMLFCWLICTVCGHRNHYRCPIKRVEIND